MKKVAWFYCNQIFKLQNKNVTLFPGLTHFLYWDIKSTFENIPQFFSIFAQRKMREKQK